MTQFPARPVSGGSRRPIQLGPRAARVLAAELARHGGPKTGLLVGVDAGSAVLAAAIEALLPDDKLTVVATDETAAAALGTHLAGQGRWVADRVLVAGSLGDVEPADVVILAEPLSGTAEETRARLDELVKLMNTGGVLSLVVPATTLPSGAADEIERQAALYGVGSDLVLRNVPPVRVHRLRYTAADQAVVERMLPAHRSSSVAVTRGMNIDSNGVAAAGIALGLAALTKAARPKSKLWIVPALAAAPVAAFFRDPQRDSPDDPKAVVAASDGKVLAVERLRDERFGDGEFLRIAVFLSVLDVHVNRSPVAGRVVEHFVEDGGYAAAMKAAAEHNVAAYTVLDTAYGRVVVAQRTGLIARRIVQRAPIGSVLARGERFGLIRFGSRTDVYLPADRATPEVAPGDRVVGGVTVIARWS
ncbi:phosphatidylserine decarboxylase family protein [Planosporangium thailandense]|uniref:Phosphatidylserine decarboxylase family protein n=1 Tax=Planosporangium thailandense TaxID=765197 RepID=A0ABX0XWM1_9ACTN|nr:phosphatidylserine decarboxylase [Planosporangium thailandense]NJC70203.1 phosphatidylserine decarboxylase family protein [Planosporangium thailandense]